MATVGRLLPLFLAATACGRSTPAPEVATDTLTIQVPMRRGASDRAVSLPVLRFRAHAGSRTDNEAVFWFGGGPGQSNLRLGAARRLLGQSDVVRVGYRGADGEPRLDCPEVTAAFRRTGDPLLPEGLQRIGDATAACHRRLLAEGTDINGFTPLDVVDDVEAARKALGYERIAVVGESYGTRLAYLYAARYPSRTARVVLLGANPPGHMVWDGRQTDSLLAEMAVRWDRVHPGRRLMDDMRTVSADFPRRWLGMPIREGAVRAATFAFLFDLRTAAPALDAWQAAARGDAGGLWLLSVAAHFVFPTIVNWGDNNAKAMSADHVAGTDYRARMLPDGHVLGAPLGFLLWSMASYWPMAPMPDEWRALRNVKAPALIIDGNLDVTTPAANAARDLLPVMPNARLVVLRDAGHVGDLWGTHADATERMMTSFLATGVADTSLVRDVPAGLRVARRYTSMAKLIVGAAVLLVLLLAGGTYAIARRVRRRAAAA